MSRPTLLGIAVFLALLAAPGCAREAAPPPDAAALEAEWRALVERRNELFRSDSSPLPEPARADFPGLTYYPFASEFAATAALVPTLTPDTLYVPTSTGEMRPMARVGHLTFALGGVPQRLVAYQPAGPLGAGRLFVPFRDRTSGRETFGGGRYMDVEVGESGRVVVDFNTAYHPYCVYNEAYSCPLPPPENTLPLAVEAGERFGEGVAYPAAPPSR
ncbi:MAG: DUF1684 domain-containing protein [Rubricoccaceae bacterium]